MSLDKAIKHGKEKRKPYTGAKSIDCTCRNHGSCPWCKKNRTFRFRDKHPGDMYDDGDKLSSSVQELQDDNNTGS